MKYITNFVTYSILLLFITVATAADQNNNFTLGAHSFEQGEYQQALIYFNKALQNGLTSPELYYGLGSTYYKTGDYEKSRGYFQSLTDNEKYGALAQYNLGLIANKNSDYTSAIKHFKICVKTSRNYNLVKLSKKQIIILKNKNRNRWSGYILGGLGHDSNITSEPDNLAINQSGTFGYANALANYIISGSKKNGLLTKSSVYTKDYLNSNDSDHNYINLGLSLRDKINNWKFIYDINFKQSNYGHEDYQRSYLLTLAARHRFQNNNELRLRWRYEDINSLSQQFDYLEGSRQKLRTEYRINRESDRIQFLYELETNDRQNTATNNYSPTRHSFTAKYNNTLDNNNAIGGDITYRTSDYDATATESRSDDRLGGAIKHTYKLDNSWKLKSRIKHTVNNSNKPDSDYDKTLITVDLFLNF